MTTYNELQANKAAAIAAKLAKSGESLGDYTARTGINPDVVVSGGEVMFDVNAAPAPVLPPAPPAIPGAGTGAGADPGGSLNYGGGGIDWGADVSGEGWFDTFSGGGGGLFGIDLGGLGGGGGFWDNILGAIPAVTGGLEALGFSGLAGTIGTIGGVAAAGYGILQALGLGEGGGLFNNNLLGGDSPDQIPLPAGGNQMTTSMITLGGPGLAEPTGEWVILKEWENRYGGTPGPTTRLHFWLTQRRYQLGKRSGKYVLMYNFGTKTYKSWPLRTAPLAVIGKNIPKHKTIVRLRKNLSKHRQDADTILSLTSPTYIETKARRRHARGRRR